MTDPLDTRAVTPDKVGDKPPVIDSAKARVLFGLLAKNASRAMACHAAKIKYTEFKRYMERGERQKDGEYRRFYEEVLWHEAWGEHELLMVIQEDAVKHKNVASARYLLERRYRNRWAQLPTAKAGTMPVLPSPTENVDTEIQLDVQERLARIEALKAIAAERQTKKLANAEPAEPLEVAVVEPPVEEG